MSVPYLTIDGPVDLCNLRECDLTAGKIASGLAKINRFNGRTTVPWSVASHSVLVSWISPPGLEAWGLLHDAHEFLLGDWATPSVNFVARQFQPSFRTNIPLAIKLAKAKIDDAISLVWGLPEKADFAALNAADMIAYEAEKFIFLGEPPSCVGTSDEDIFERAVSLIHELPKDTAWRDAHDVWSARARHLAGLGHLRLPGDGKEPLRMMRAETAQEKTA